MMDILKDWLFFPGIAFQVLLALATAWMESALAVLFESRRPMSPFRFVLHWLKGFAKRPVPIRMNWLLILDALVIIASGWLGLAVFSKHGFRFDLPLVVLVLLLAESRRHPFSISHWIRLGICFFGFTIPGAYPGDTFRLSDVMQFQENYGPLIGTLSGALAAFSAWIGLAFSIFRAGGTSSSYTGPISTVSSFLYRSGTSWLWTACFVGGSWHGLSSFRMLAAWTMLILSFVLARLLPPLQERAQKRLNFYAGAAVAIAAMLAWGGRGS